MSAYGSLFRGALYPFYESVLLRRGTLRYLDEYERTQWFSPEQTRSKQAANLRAMLVHCGEHVPYYRRLFQEIRFDPRAVESVEQLAALPVLNRDLIRKHHDELIDERLDPASLISQGTGGSTGAPLQFKISHDYYERRMASHYRNYRWAGWDLGNKTLWFTGVRGRVNPSPPPFRKALKKAVYQAFWRNVVKTLYQFSEPKLAEYITFWNRWRPASVWGYAFGTYCVARYVLDNKLSVPPCNGVILGAEATTPEQRAVMREAFGTGIFNTYGCMEFDGVASECSAHQGMHVNCDNVLVEITRDGKPLPPGESGEITITGLAHTAMPFVRYVIGDQGRLAARTCACGRGFPLLEEVAGRSMDIVRTPEGNFISGVWFNHTMRLVKEVKRFQVVQETVDEITLRIVPADGYGPELERKLDGQLRNALGPKIGIRFQVVDEVELANSGKYRVIISKAGFGHEPPPASSSS